MFANPPLSLKLRKVFFVALLVLICAILVYWLTQENKLWVVPEEYKSLKNPLPASPSNLNAAREIYFDECEQCHGDRKSTRLNSSHGYISYAVFCLKKKNNTQTKSLSCVRTPLSESSIDRVDRP